MADLYGDYESSSDSDWEAMDGEEEENVVLESECLFCCQRKPSPETVFKHVLDDHGVDIVSHFKKRSFDCFDYIKTINYVRQEKVPSDQLESVLEAGLWRDEQYMKPTLPEDGLLLFDFEHEKESATDVSPDDTPAVNSALSDGDKVVDLSRKVKHLEEILLELRDKNERMAKTLRKIVEDKAGDGEGQGDVRQLTESEDSSYFYSYAHFGIHQEMLSDKVRTDSYRDAILGNKSAFEGKRVLDIGCGTGILSMFAASAGAEKVQAVDMSDIVYYAMDIIKDNDLSSKIDVQKGKLETISTVIKYDVIISEWMGYFLLYEGMLDTILYAREKLLNEGGVLLPNRCTLSIAGVSDSRFHENHVAFWDNVYGFKMSCLKKETLVEPVVNVIPANSIVTEEFVIKEFNLMTCSLEETHDFEADFSMKCTKKGLITAICGWFDCYFDSELLKEKKVRLSTAPFSKATHWKQTLFLLQSPVHHNEGDLIEGKMRVSRSKRDVRSLVIKVSLANEKRQQVYEM